LGAAGTELGVLARAIRPMLLIGTSSVRGSRLRRCSGPTRVVQAAAPRGGRTERVPFSVAVSLSTRQEESQLERPPDFGDYRPPRTTAEGGATMLLSGVFFAGALVALALAVYTKLADVRTFGQIGNLLVFAVALLLIAIYLLVWEIALRLIARSDD
jgi:hypothetical protein